MRLKHNKKRNTAFVYEVLVRELTKSVVKHDRHKQNKIVSIMKEHFSADKLLNRELDLYRTIYETRDIERHLAEKIIIEVKKRHSQLNKGKIFKEQTALINKINRTLSNKVFNNFVPNYKHIASVYSIFNDEVPVKDRVLLEENLAAHMSSSAGLVTEGIQAPVDNIVYKTFVNKFNEEYSEKLDAAQKDVLSKYISSFSDNGLELKVTINEDIGRLKESLQKSKETQVVLENEDIKDKVDRVCTILDDCKNREIDAEMIEFVLKTQKLVEEIEENADNT